MVTKEAILVQDLGDGIRSLTLRRAPVNALNPEFLQEFSDILDQLAPDDDVRAVIIDSAFKVFSAGLDLKEAQDFDLAAQQAIVRGLNQSFTKLFSFPKPTIAAIGGAAIAGGLFFVLASDYRIATPHSKFGLAEVRVGADFPVGPLEIARATLNPNDLRRMMLSGQPVGIDAALTAGIVDVVVEVEVLMEAALKVAHDYAQIPPKTFAKVKHQIRSGTISIIENAMDNGANAPVDGWFNDETRGAMAAMID